MEMKKTLFSISLIVTMLLAACSNTTSQTTTEEPQRQSSPQEEILYLNILWHQHQPLYYKDEDGVYTRPWVRVHATKDYYDMAAILKEYPDVHATFNLTPVLMRQLDDFVENDAKDLYWVLAEMPADQLTADQKEFILSRFFDANWDNIIYRFPRYKELLLKRGGTDEAAISAAMETYTTQDFLDLQVWFNLAWFDPDFLAQEPLKTLVEKGEEFSEEDKQIVFSEVRNVMADIIPLHKEMQDSGQIEVITTPYAHPILPLIYNSDLAAVGNPTTDLPERFSWPNDAIAHLSNSVTIYEEHFGKNPNGLWPGEGSVAEDVVPLIADAGYSWMATGEPVLAASFGMANFTRDSHETVQEADVLYRPYYVQGAQGDAVAIFFRDWTLSDKVGFTYSQTPGEEAAADLMQRLENIRQQLKDENVQGAHIVSIVLDGENAWEYYPNDGKEFLHALYRMLSESETIKTVTPSEYLEMFPEQQEIEDLFPGAWFSANYDTWIGEDEENQAWNYLGKVRDHLAKYDLTQKREASEEAIALAQDYMYLAEGSDWFWWYGADQDSGQDSYFDLGFRELLKKVYESLGDEVPAFLSVPIIPPAAVVPDQYLTAPSTVTVDGQATADEWSTAAIYNNSKPGETLTSMAVSMDASNLYIQLELSSADAMQNGFDIYLRIPKMVEYYPFMMNESGSDQIGIAASHLLHVAPVGESSYLVENETWVETDLTWTVAQQNTTVEIAIPFDQLGELETGDAILIKAIDPTNVEIFPASGPAEISLLQIGAYTSAIEIQDPEGDDHGPGSYTYPSDAAFLPQVFDINTFQVSYNDKYVLFDFTFFGQITNPWGSGVDLSLQTMDVYIDMDPGTGSGTRQLLPGRNLTLEEGFGWDIALWAEGWYPEILSPDPTTSEPMNTNTEMKILVDPATNKVTLRVPRTVFGDSMPEDWAFSAMVLSQDGYPSLGVWRVRDVNQNAEQWRLGGAPASSGNHTRVVDMVWSVDAEGSQEEMLGNFTPLDKGQSELTMQDYALIRMFSLPITAE
ncbi:MAG TPA: glycoside hydrolase [Anaerolineaceae bacterium]|nr:glycoside hydrolase [Anaerolineaceae bacterium]